MTDALLALAGFSPMIFAKADMLISQLARRTDKAVNFTQWSFYYAFDIMGLVGLDTDFGMVETGKEHKAISALHGQMTAVGVLGTVPWLLSLLAKLPVSGGFGVFMKFCVDELDRKIEVRCGTELLLFVSGADEQRLGRQWAKIKTPRISCHGFSVQSTRKMSLSRPGDWLSKMMLVC